MAHRPLKVFRTSIGFADAYIAAPSQKAALEAWGANRNLFASGMAEIVTDQALTTAPLASPGTVVRVSKGTTADHLAAAETAKSDGAPDEDPDEDKGGKENRSAEAKRTPIKPKPRPSRQKLDDAHAALDQRRRELDAQRADIDAQIEGLRAERARLKGEGDAEISGLETLIEREDKAYRKALEHWRG